MVIKILNALIAVVAGVAGAIVLYYLLNKLAELLPGKWEDRVKPYLYLLPALAAITLYLIYPTVQTLVYSFANGPAPSSSAPQLRQAADPPELPEHAVQHVPLDPRRAGRGSCSACSSPPSPTGWAPRRESSPRP